MSTLAATEGHLIARRVDGDECNFDRFSQNPILTTIEQDGMTHSSKIVFPEMRFNFQWKAPIAPKAKKALFAFLIASQYHTNGVLNIRVRR